MVLLIVAGLVWTVYADSIAVAIVTAALILYRAQRPSKFRQRLRDFQYARQATEVGAGGEDVRE